MITEYAGASSVLLSGTQIQGKPQGVAGFAFLSRPGSVRTFAARVGHFANGIHNHLFRHETDWAIERHLVTVLVMCFRARSVGSMHG